MQQKKSAIKGVGAVLPSTVVTNEELSTMVDTSDSWIVQRTGIRQRHVVAEDESCASLATRAAERALANAGIHANHLDAIVVATTSADNVFPSVGAVVSRNLGIKNTAPAFDVAAACAGFVFALNSADNLIRLGQAKMVLVVGVDIFSRLVDWRDRSTCVLFGDGAGAVVLSETSSKNHILSTHLHCDASFCDDLVANSKPGDPERSVRGITMNGKSVYKFAVSAMTIGLKEALRHNKYSVEDLDFVVPHQANIRIIHKIAQTLNIPSQKVIKSVQAHANTSAATIPLALDKATKDGVFSRGDLIVLTSMGAGFTWGSALLRWFLP